MAMPLIKERLLKDKQSKGHHVRQQWKEALLLGNPQTEVQKELYEVLQTEHKGRLQDLRRELQEVLPTEALQVRGRREKLLLEVQEVQLVEVHLLDRWEKHLQEVQEVTEAPHPQEVEEGNKDSF